MAIRNKIEFLALAAFILLTGSRCTNEARLLEQVPESSFIDNCPDVLHDFGDMVSVADPNRKFAIQLPYAWDIRESYGDSLYGVFASNFLSIPIPLDARLALSVTGYNHEGELAAYMRADLADLIRDENIRVMERGSSTFAGRANPWVLFEMIPGIFNMVYYLQKPGQQEIFIIQSVSYDTVNYRNKMCQLKQLVNSFEWMEYGR